MFEAVFQFRIKTRFSRQNFRNRDFLRKIIDKIFEQKIIFSSEIFKLILRKAQFFDSEIIHFVFYNS